MKHARATLVILFLFGAFSAVVGAVMALVFNGAGMPLASLEGSPFHSFVVPGLILGLVVGGTQLLAALALLANRQWSLLAAAVAGFGMLIWIFVELAVIHGYSFLQAVYFGLGIVELALVLALLGVAGSAVAVERDRAAPDRGPGFSR
ncbi:hypothetical protein [Specibacter sp. NPDC078692]|uniref:hypothetical protein n=1 Tax=Specibacter sp. NPDC078692 TaxID=3155818 RepID=UPI0034201868